MYDFQYYNYFNKNKQYDTRDIKYDNNLVKIVESRNACCFGVSCTLHDNFDIIRYNINQIKTILERFPLIFKDCRA